VFFIDDENIKPDEIVEETKESIIKTINNSESVIAG